eukprot:CAMPEP_0197021296 /NCGR_PEP_ID=MMETSP1384-20130603/2177_1 /TAXON_ID=29189 /ORGANISM="Ammonia sp." /LENGTH=326 /DNA_ID=CAMNT_0042449085 /DNA_START=71 /DNA_END=1051 /DNA_ORIENTATION=+
MSVISCNNTSTISESEWFRYLYAVDIDITRYYDEDTVIILSAPSSPEQIKSILADSFVKNHNEFCLFCCDLITDFLFFDKKYVSSKLCHITAEVYNNFLCSNALTIIHCKSGEIFNLPRYINALPSSHKDATISNERSSRSENGEISQRTDREMEMSETSEFQIEFMNHPKYCSIIKDCVYQQLIQTFRAHEFRLIDADWSRKQEFYGVFSIGYRCDDGKVVPADIIMQRDDKLFIHFGTFGDQSGQKFGWISVPNDRVSPPPKTAYSRQAHLWHIYNQQRNRNNANDNDQNLNDGNDLEAVSEQRVAASWTFRYQFCRDSDSQRL